MLMIWMLIPIDDNEYAILYEHLHIYELKLKCECFQKMLEII